MSLSTTTTTTTTTTPRILLPEQLGEADVVIEDELLVALASPDANKEGSTELTTSFYTKLIQVCSEKLHIQRQTDVDWSRENLLTAAQKMADIVIFQRQGRFIWSKQLLPPTRQLVVLDRQEAINKITSDLTVQMRRLVTATTTTTTTSNRYDATTDGSAASLNAAVPNDPWQQQQSSVQAQTLGGNSNSDNEQLQYAVRLIMAVCQAGQSGQSPLQAAHALDQVPWNNTSTKSKKPKQQQTEDTTESSRERKMRLLLRHRYLSAAATGVPLYDFSKALLESWNVHLPKPLRRKKKKKKKTNVATMNGADQQQREQQSVAFAQQDPFQHDYQGAATTSSTTTAGIQGLPLSRPLRQDNTTFNKNENGKVSKVEGTWLAYEKKAFLAGLEEFGFGKWKDIEKSIPTRTKLQVACYGRYIAKKFKQKPEDFPNDKCRAYLLKEDE